MKDAFDIAAAVVAHFNGEAVKADSPVKVDAKFVRIVETKRTDDGPTLQVQAWSEEEEPEDNGDMQNARRSINVVLSCPLDAEADFDRCRAWLQHLKASFALLTLELGEGQEWQWVGNETVVLLDSDASDRDQYLSQFRPSFQNFA